MTSLQRDHWPSKLSCSPGPSPLAKSGESFAALWNDGEPPVLCFGKRRLPWTLLEEGSSGVCPPPFPFALTPSAFWLYGIDRVKSPAGVNDGAHVSEELLKVPNGPRGGEAAEEFQQYQFLCAHGPLYSYGPRHKGAHCHTAPHPFPPTPPCPAKRSSLLASRRRS